jgi:hypothetical protein
MAINTYIIGNDGNVTLSNSTAVMTIKSFAATLARQSFDVTAFGDASKRRRLGMLDLTGSLNAVAGIASAGSADTASFLTSSATAALTLTIFDGASADAKIAANCVFNSFAFNADKNGEMGLTANFETGDGTAPVVTWLV